MTKSREGRQDPGPRAGGPANGDGECCKGLECFSQAEFVQAELSSLLYMPAWQ